MYGAKYILVTDAFVWIKIITITLHSWPAVSKQLSTHYYERDADWAIVGALGTLKYGCSFIEPKNDKFV